MRKNLIIIASVLIIAIVLVVSTTKLTWDYAITRRAKLEVSPTLEVSETRFFNHPEAWTEVFNNVSSIPKYWNADIPAILGGRSMPNIVQMYFGEVFLNNADYAYCYISVHSFTSQFLNRTLTGIGLCVIDIVYVHPNRA